MNFKSLMAVALVGALSGCASYRWTSAVPEEMRTVAVPTFRNGSEVTELGSVTTRQILREFQREGTFRIAALDDAAVRIEGEIVDASMAGYAADYRAGARHSEYRFAMKAKVSVIDERRHKVIVDNRPYTAEVFCVAGQDLQTARRDASGRLADELARQVVDDVLGLQW